MGRGGEGWVGGWATEEQAQISPPLARTHVPATPSTDVPCRGSPPSLPTPPAAPTGGLVEAVGGAAVHAPRGLGVQQLGLRLRGQLQADGHGGGHMQSVSKQAQGPRNQARGWPHPPPPPPLARASAPQPSLHRHHHHHHHIPTTTATPCSRVRAPPPSPPRVPPQAGRAAGCGRARGQRVFIHATFKQQGTGKETLARAQQSSTACRLARTAHLAARQHARPTCARR